MSSQIEVFVIGESTDLPARAIDANISPQLRLIPTGARTLGEFPGTPWARQIVEGAGEFAALVCRNVDEAICDLRMAFDVELRSGVAAVVTVDPVDQGDSP